MSVLQGRPPGDAAPEQARRGSRPRSLFSVEHIVYPSFALASLMPRVGEDKFFWASDYPHPDHPGAYLEELRRMVAPMTESGRRGILGENVARACRLA